jgi:hypothetical protein
MADRARERIGRVGARISGKREQATHHVLHLILPCVTLPTTDCLTCSAVYSDTGSPASTAAQIAVPRACPSASVDCALTLTNTFSIATSCGAFAAITSARPVEDRLQPRGQLAGPGAHAAARDVMQLAARSFDDSETGDAQARIDAEDAQGAHASPSAAVV